MKITAINKEQAWQEASKLFPTDYEKDYAASQRAGYDIYRHTTLNYYSRICDLGDRLEVLTGEWGENVTNIWIEPEIISGMGTEMSQFDYEKLCGSDTRWEMTEEEAKIFVNDEFGFEASRIEIIPEVEVFIKDGNHCKVYQKFTRTPQNCASDYNYVRFNVCGYYYEIVNGHLHKYYC